tara:strand:- start:158 stop:304 length:147 start_codon:yes stop_codon:yes gene_type:complete
MKGSPLEPAVLIIIQLAPTVLFYTLNRRHVTVGLIEPVSFSLNLFLFP